MSRVDKYTKQINGKTSQEAQLNTPKIHCRFPEWWVFEHSISWFYCFKILCTAT